MALAVALTVAVAVAAVAPVNVAALVIRNEIVSVIDAVDDHAPPAGSGSDG